MEDVETRKKQEKEKIREEKFKKCFQIIEV